VRKKLCIGGVPQKKSCKIEYIKLSDNINLHIEEVLHSGGLNIMIAATEPKINF